VPGETRFLQGTYSTDKPDNFRKPKLQQEYNWKKTSANKRHFAIAPQDDAYSKQTAFGKTWGRMFLCV